MPEQASKGTEKAREGTRYKQMACFYSIIYGLILSIFSVVLFPQLPPLRWVLLSLVLVVLLLGWLILWLRAKTLYAGLLISQCFLAISCGVGYGIVWGHISLSHQLPDSLTPVDVSVRGRVIGLPDTNPQRTKFQLRLTEPLWVMHAGQRVVLPLDKLQLSWYQQTGKSDVPVLRPGDTWSFHVRLRRPRGSVNPGGFDYQAWLLRQGISAVGYVRSPEHAVLQGRRWCFDLWRYQLSEKIASLPLSSEAQSLLSALTLGDRSAISDQLWSQLSQLGVVHLLVVSGLHIGLVAAMGFAIGMVIGGVFMLLNPSINGRTMAVWCSLCLAVCYSFLAGFSLPTQRALVMLTVVWLALLCGRSVSRPAAFAIAMLLVVLLDPLACLTAGFWLSFIAVAGLLWLLPRRLVTSHRSLSLHASDLEPQNRRIWHISKALLWWKAPLSKAPLSKAPVIRQWCSKGQIFFYAQWMLMVLLMLPLLVSQLPLSWVSPLINAVAIPWVSFTIVPCCLLGAIFIMWAPAVGDFFWQLAGWQLQGFVASSNGVTHLLASLSGGDAYGFASVVTPYGLFTCVFGVALLAVMLLILLLPKGLGVRYLLIPLAVVAVLYRPDKPSLLITVLDVGQGLSVVIQTPRHRLVYDTGIAYAGGFDAGQKLLVPFIQQQVQSLERPAAVVDRLIVSHGDRDHSGGAGALVSTFPPQVIFAGQPALLKQQLSLSALGVVSGSHPHHTDAIEVALPPIASCHEVEEANRQWQWDGVDFMLLNSGVKDLRDRNNRSCVLLVRVGEYKVLLPGDIESLAERRLLVRYPKLLHNVDVLVAPHHGSATSSTAAFVSHLNPSHVVFSAGYHHYFGHPAPKVMSRYHRMGTAQWNTADDGAIQFRWQSTEVKAGHDMTVVAWRQVRPRYWY